MELRRISLSWEILGMWKHSTLSLVIYSVTVSIELSVHQTHFWWKLSNQKITQIKHVDLEVIFPIATPKITALKCNDLEPFNIFLVLWKAAKGPYETPLVLLK